MINIDNFNELELLVGTIIKVESFPEAHKPAYKLKIDFGSYGKKWSSAQITNNYSIEELTERQIVAAMNLGEKKIGPFTSEVLVMGAEDESGNIILMEVDQNIKNGAKVN